MELSTNKEEASEPIVKKNRWKKTPVLVVAEKIQEMLWKVKGIRKKRRGKKSDNMNYRGEYFGLHY